MKILTTNSVGVATPVLDDKGKPFQVEVKHKGITRKINAHESTVHPANTVLDLSDEDAKELIAKGFATEYDEALAPDELIAGQGEAEKKDDALDA